MRILLGPILEIDKNRCLSWSAERAPCQASCPLGIDVEGYVKAIASGNFRLALDIIKRECPLPAVCAHICYAPCENVCKRAKIDEPVAILDLKRAAVDYTSKEVEIRKPKKRLSDDEKVAVVGSGPAGLSCAYYLNQQGYHVTIFEASPFIGGMLRLAIPDYRLPKATLKDEVDSIKKLGVEIRTSTPINKDLTIDDLFHQGYKAVFIGTGAHSSQKLAIPEEDSDRVTHGIHFLRDLNLGKKLKIGKKVVVVGGGNVAIDCARCALRLGSDVSILYRRSREEMPASNSEIEAAESEGVKIECLVAPVEINAVDGKVASMRCVRTRLGAPDASGRRQPIPVPDSDFNVDVDTVIVAIGQTPDLSFLTENSGIETTEEGPLMVNPETLGTTREGVFAGGDVQTGPDTAIAAMAAGKKAAASIDRYLSGRELKREADTTPSANKAEMLPHGIILRGCERALLLPTIVRIRGFEQVKLGLTPEQAIREAKRCLRCGTCNRCLEGFDCVAISACTNNGKLSPCIDEDLCVGCQVCSQVCPYGSIRQMEVVR